MEIDYQHEDYSRLNPVVARQRQKQVLMAMFDEVPEVSGVPLFHPPRRRQLFVLSTSSSKDGGAILEDLRFVSAYVVGICHQCCYRVHTM